MKKQEKLFSSISVSKEFYNKLKSYCNKKGLKISLFVETKMTNIIKRSGKSD